MMLHVENGKVRYLMPTGDDIVVGRFHAATVRSLIAEGGAKESDRFVGYPIQIDDFYFEGTWDTSFSDSED